MKVRISLFLRYAASDDALIITKYVYQAFRRKFLYLLPKNTKTAFLFFYEYYYNGLKKYTNKIILVLDSDKNILAILVLEGLGIPIFSLNPPLRILINKYKKVGFKSLFRLIIGIFLIEGYPPSNKYLYINTLIVHPNYRRKKIGLKLMGVAEIIARKKRKAGLSLYVSADNKPALELYRKLNFKQQGGFGNAYVESIIGVKKYFYLVKDFEK